MNILIAQLKIITTKGSSPEANCLMLKAQPILSKDMQPHDILHNPQIFAGKLQPYEMLEQIMLLA